MPDLLHDKLENGTDVGTAKEIWVSASVSGAVAGSGYNATQPTKFSSLTDVYEFDWGAGSGPTLEGGLWVCKPETPAPTSFLRRTHTDYVAHSNIEYRLFDAHLFSLPSRVVTTGVDGATGAVTAAAETTYGYDQSGVFDRGTVVGNAGTAVVLHKRGNPTAVSSRIDGSTLATVTRTFDSLGNRISETDARGKTTNFGFDDDTELASGSGTVNRPGGIGNTWAFVNKIEQPAPRATGAARPTWRWKVDYYSGRPMSAVAATGLISSYDWTVPLDRLKSVTRGGAGQTGQQQTAYSYTDALNAHSVTVQMAHFAAADGLRRQQSCYDGLGREYKAMSGTATSLYDTVGKTYDGFGRLRAVSNPVTLGAADCGALAAGAALWTTTEYDFLDRATAVVTPGGSRTETTYVNQERTVKEPSTPARYMKYREDAVGRLAEVVEDAVAGGANWSTTYGYDAAARLRSVTQGAQGRAFVYDQAGRLTSAQNPESGLMAYKYDLAGNLIWRKDARGVETCFGAFSGTDACDGAGIDGLGRPTLKQYRIPNVGTATAAAAATPSVVSCYDGQTLNAAGTACEGPEADVERGLLTAVGHAQASTAYAHDLAGRLMASTPKVTGLTLANGFGYGYYASDALGELRYPSGRLVRYCPDDKLRVKWVSAAKSMGDCISGVAPAQGEAYASGIEYAPHGAPFRWNLGNGLKEAVGFNARLQPERLRVGTANDPAVACGLATDALCLELSYGSLTGNTGNILSQRIWAAKASGGHLNIEQGYGYDAVNRLTTFTETVVGGGGATAGNWTETNQYDRWGNRWATSTASQHAATPRMASHINTAKNQVTATLAGSVGYDPGGNMITHPSYGAMVYDAENRVVSAGGASYGYDGEGRRVSKTVNGATVYYLYDGQGQLAVEMGGDSAPVGTTYVHVDHLGSTRMVTDAGAAVKSRTDYTAFGEEIAATAALGNRDLVPAYGAAGPLVRYTGHVRDTESGLDYFGARHMASAVGRFVSADVPLLDQHAHDPKSWNLYAYGRNNPARNVDPTGNVVETLWDIANAAMDVVSLGKNIAAGNWVGAAVDAGGLIVDGAAAVFPGIPGGAGTAIKAARAAETIADGAQSVKRASTIAENAKLGKAFEQKVVTALKKENPGVVEQLTVKTQNGTKVRLDAAGKDAKGNITLFEAKGSATAGLTKNQKKGFPEIQQGGATVVGKGRPGFPAGTQLPPTSVRVIRPDDLKNLSQ